MTQELCVDIYTYISAKQGPDLSDASLHAEFVLQVLAAFLPFFCTEIFTDLDTSTQTFDTCR